LNDKAGGRRQEEKIRQKGKGRRQKGKIVEMRFITRLVSSFF
jgi:hypothetical protein